MIAIEQARAHLETLGLSQAVEVLDDAARKQLPYPEMLADLLGVEVAARRERYLTTRTRMAKLPFQRTLEQFDFSFQPSIGRETGEGACDYGVRVGGDQWCCCWVLRESARRTWRSHSL